MIGIDIDYRVSNKLPELSRKLSVPLRDLSRVLASRIRSRVVDEGKSSQLRQFSRLGTYRNSNGAGQRPDWKWWVPPPKGVARQTVQPPGYLFRVETGEWKGYAVYRNFQDYISRLPQKMQWRRMYRTGETWASLRVRVMSRSRMKVAFYGTKKTSKNARSRVAYGQVAYLAVRQERPPNVLDYSEQDRQWFVSQIQHQLETGWRDVLTGSAAGARIPRTGIQGWAVRPTVRQV